MQYRDKIKNANRWVIKIGSSLLTDEGRVLDISAIKSWVQQIAQLREQGLEFVLVSSGAVAAGMSRLGWTQRPSSIHKLQAAAAVGQMGLIQAYEQAFQQYNLHTAQVLVDHDDLSNRERYLNARTTLTTLLELGVIPIINENDTVVTDEIRFGDNDTLAGLIANLVESDVLILLTDQEGMYTADPRKDKTATLIEYISTNDSSLEEMAADSSSIGRGGMITKVRAARLAARSGTHTVIASGYQKDIITRLAEGAALGTLLFADRQPQAARKRWLAGQLQCRGELVLDDGAVSVLKRSGRSLLSVGITMVRGQFSRGDLVVCRDQEGNEVARGLVNYSHREVALVKGKPSHTMESLLGYKNEEEIVHRDNLVLTK